MFSLNSKFFPVVATTWTWWSGLFFLMTRLNCVGWNNHHYIFGHIGWKAIRSNRVVMVWKRCHATLYSRTTTVWCSFTRSWPTTTMPSHYWYVGFSKASTPRLTLCVFVTGDNILNVHSQFTKNHSQTWRTCQVTKGCLLNSINSFLGTGKHSKVNLVFRCLN